MTMGADLLFRLQLYSCRSYSAVRLQFYVTVLAADDDQHRAYRARGRRGM